MFKFIGYSAAVMVIAAKPGGPYSPSIRTRGTLEELARDAAAEVDISRQGKGAR